MNSKKIEGVDDEHLPNNNFYFFGCLVIPFIALISNGGLVSSFLGQFLKLEYGPTFLIGFGFVGLAFNLKSYLRIFDRFFTCLQIYGIFFNLFLGFELFLFGNDFCFCLFNGNITKDSVYILT